VLQGLKGLPAGTTDSPPTLNLAVNGGDTGGDVDAPADSFSVPFAEQTGLTRYAPMQVVPPTKITATNTKPLFPTSAFDIAQTYLKPAKQETTVTQVQTFVAESRINNVS
jgi:hypothetical protein